MDIYELISKIKSSQSEHYFDVFPNSFNQSNRIKLQVPFDLAIFDLFIQRALGKESVVLTLVEKRRITISPLMILFQ